MTESGRRAADSSAARRPGRTQRGRYSSRSAHTICEPFVTTAYRNGVPDEEIMGHTRHRSLTTMRSYLRRAKLGHASPAGRIGL